MTRSLITRLGPVLVLLLKLPTALPATEFHVAQRGDDGNPGTRDKPFATPERARDEIRRWNAAGAYPKEGVTVWLHGGVYLRDRSLDLDARDSGKADAAVVYAAVPGETVRLIGGRIIPASAFRPVTDRVWLERVIERGARRHLLQVDLKALGITDYGELRPMHAVDFGSNTHYLPAPLELFIDGQAMTLARWPNANEARPLRAMVESASMIIDRDEQGRPKSYRAVSLNNVPAAWGDGDEAGVAPRLALDRVSRWQPPLEAWIAGGLVRTYAHTARRISAVDAKAGTLRLETPVGLWPTYNQTELHRFYFCNLPEEVDAPGEYYLDRQSGVLTLYPPAGFSEKSEIVVSMLNDVLVAMEGCSHVRLRGVVLEATRTSGIYVERGEDCVIENCVIRNTGVVGVQIGLGWDTGLAGEWDALSARGASVPAEVKQAGPGKPLARLPGAYRHVLCTGLGGLPNRLPGATAWDRAGGRRNGLAGCTIYDAGVGGVLLGGGDRKTLTPAGNFVRDCEIFRTGRRHRLYAENIVVDGVGNRVEGCYLHDNDGGILYLHGNDHVIEFNEIARGVRTSSDCGAIEIRQNPSQLGNVIRHNFIHDNGRADNAQTVAIYLDNEVHGVQVVGNVFARNHGRTVAGYGRVVVAINGGHDHVIANNVFVDNDGGMVGDGHDWEKSQGVFRSRRLMLEGDVDVTRPPFSMRYPGFLRTYRADAAAPLYNRVFNNVLVGCGASVGAGRYPEKGYRHHNLDYDTDPGFVNLAAGDLTLRPDSIVFQQIPGFEPIPFAQMRRAKGKP